MTLRRRSDWAPVVLLVLVSCWGVSAIQNEAHLAPAPGASDAAARLADRLLGTGDDAVNNYLDATAPDDDASSSVRFAERPSGVEVDPALDRLDRLQRGSLPTPITSRRASSSHVHRHGPKHRVLKTVHRKPSDDSANYRFMGVTAEDIKLAKDAANILIDVEKKKPYARPVSLSAAQEAAFADTDPAEAAYRANGITNEDSDAGDDAPTEQERDDTGASEDVQDNAQSQSQSSVTDTPMPQVNTAAAPVAAEEDPNLKDKDVPDMQAMSAKDFIQAEKRLRAPDSPYAMSKQDFLKNLGDVSAEEKKQQLKLWKAFNAQDDRESVRPPRQLDEPEF